jgi:hypothetical protein
VKEAFNRLREERRLMLETLKQQNGENSILMHILAPSTVPDWRKPHLEEV